MAACHAYDAYDAHAYDARTYDARAYDAHAYGGCVEGMHMRIACIGRARPPRLFRSPPIRSPYALDAMDAMYVYVCTWVTSNKASLCIRREVCTCVYMGHLQ